MTEESATALLENPADENTIPHARYHELCLQNGGERGLWRMLSESFRKHLHLTSSHERAMYKTAMEYSKRWSLTYSQTTKLHVKLRKKFDPAK